MHHPQKNPLGYDAISVRAVRSADVLNLAFIQPVFLLMMSEHHFHIIFAGFLIKAGGRPWNIFIGLAFNEGSRSSFFHRRLWPSKVTAASRTLKVESLKGRGTERGYLKKGKMQ